MSAEAVFDPRDISPAVSARFSPNLYRWTARNMKRFRLMPRGYTDTDGVRHVGFSFEDDVVAAQLSYVLAVGSRATVYSHGMQRLTEIPDFFGDYQQGGRCFIDPAHKMSFVDERYVAVGNRRTCRWCGVEQLREERTRITTYEVWTNAEASP